MAGIKETCDLINAATAVVEALEKALEDGHIDLRDFPLAPALFQDLQEAYDGVSDVPAELSDLDEAEVKELAADLITLVFKAVHVYKVCVEGDM